MQKSLWSCVYLHLLWVNAHFVLKMNVCLHSILYRYAKESMLIQYFVVNDFPGLSFPLSPLEITHYLHNM